MTLENIIVKLRRENEELRRKFYLLHPEEYADKFCDCACHKTGGSVWGCCRCTAVGDPPWKMKRGASKPEASRVKGKGARK
jgi:hypothetical protein